MQSIFLDKTFCQRNERLDSLWFGRLLLLHCGICCRSDHHRLNITRNRYCRRSSSSGWCIWFISELWYYVCRWLLVALLITYKSNGLYVEHNVYVDLLVVLCNKNLDDKVGRTKTMKLSKRISCE